METENKEAFAWSVYWAANNLHSCVASNSDADQKVLNAVWAELADRVPDNAAVLDLATGNGAVPVALLNAQAGLNITAVDQADIKPAEVVADYPELSKVNFIGNTNLNTMALDGQRFDAITSQFGVEYAGLPGALDAALGCLANQGEFVFLIHHAHSQLIESSAHKITEMYALLAPTGLIDTLLKFLRGEIPFTELENLGQAYANSPATKTQLISGQVFAGIEQIATLIDSDPDQARNLGATLGLRLQAEYDRLKQMQKAAQSAAQMAELQSHLQNRGFTISALETVTLEQGQQQYLLAWKIAGRR